MIIEYISPILTKEYLQMFEKQKEQGKKVALLDGGQIVGYFESMEEKDGKIIAKINCSDENEKALNDRLYPKFECKVSSRGVLPHETFEEFTLPDYTNKSLLEEE